MVLQCLPGAVLVPQEAMDLVLLLPGVVHLAMEQYHRQQQVLRAARKDQMLI